MYKGVFYAIFLYDGTKEIPLYPIYLVHIWYKKTKRPKLTKSYIDTLKPTEKSYEVWDTEVKGVGCMIHPSGRKTYYFVYRFNSNTKQRLKIGVHGSVTCEIARDIARGWAGDLARGIDPKEHLKKQEIEAKQSLTMEAFLALFTEKCRLRIRAGRDGLPVYVYRAIVGMEKNKRPPPAYESRLGF